MAKKPNLNAVSPLRFLKLEKVREEEIRKAPAEPLPKSFPVNELSAALHPDRQYGVISAVKVWDENCKSFTFSPDPSRGTRQFAWFQAGSYLSVFLEFDGMKLTRPYSISSSPAETKNGGTYTLTVKRVPGGLASNYILDHWKIGDKVTLSGPLGEFVYLPVRDAHTVIGLAGGSGITPFHSFAKAIVEGDEDFNLILIYGSRTEKDILFREDFDAFEKKSDKIKVVHVLSDEKKEGFEHGFITAELIGKYAPEEYSVFLCGPEAMYKFLKPEIEKLGLPERLFRRKLIDVTKTPWECEGYPQEVKGKQFTITARQGPQECSIPANADEPVLVAIERAGIKAPSRCRAGECGWCRSRLLAGTVFIPQENEMRRWADVHYGYIHPCCSFPTSDLTIEIPGEFF